MTEGAWIYSPDSEHVCPECKKPVVFATDFKKFGDRRVRVCIPCRSVFEGGKKKGSLIVFGRPA